MDTNLLVWAFVVVLLAAILVGILRYVGTPRILEVLVVLVAVFIVLIRVLDKLNIYHWHGLSK